MAYKPRILGREGTEFVPSRNNLEDWLASNMTGVTSLPPGTLQPVSLPGETEGLDVNASPDQIENERSFVEATAREYDRKIHNPPATHTPFSWEAPLPVRGDLPPAPALPDVRQQTLDAARWLPLAALFGGPRALGAIGPGLFGGIAQGADEDYARQYQVWGNQVRALNDVYDQQLKRWQLGLEGNKANADIVQTQDKQEAELYKDQLTGLGNLLKDRRAGLNNLRSQLSRQLSTYVTNLMKGGLPSDAASAAINTINDINDKLGKLGGVDTNSIDPEAAKDINFFNRVKVATAHETNANQRAKMIADAMRNRTQVEATTRLTIAQWNNALEKLRIQESKLNRTADDSIARLGIQAANLRTAASIEADLLKKRYDAEVQQGRLQDEATKAQYEAMAKRLAEKIKQRDELVLESQKYHQLAQDRTFEPSDVDSYNIKRISQDIGELTNDIKRDSQDIIQYMPGNMPRRPAPAPLGTTTTGIRQLRSGGDAGGTQKGATPQAKPSSGRGGRTQAPHAEINPNTKKVSPGRRVPGRDIRFVRPTRMTPEEKAEQDAIFR